VTAVAGALGMSEDSLLEHFKSVRTSRNRMRLMSPRNKKKSSQSSLFRVMDVALI
jgi:hypothetical protein